MSETLGIQSVHALGDEEAEGWVASCDEVSGLITGAESLDELRSKPHVLDAEILQLNQWAGSFYEAAPAKFYKE